MAVEKKTDKMKTVQTVEIILQILRAIFKKFLNVSVKLISLNVKDHLDSHR